MKTGFDYSSGHPSAQDVKTAGGVTVIRYVGTPGRGKNLTRAEAKSLLDGGISIALVYEATAGWMLEGFAAGVRAARAVLSDPALVSDASYVAPKIRNVFFADDQDTVTPSQFAAVAACLDGAAQELTKARVGVYGEADVLDYCIPQHATYGWQTLAWSNKRLSGKRHILQKLGYVYVGGIQADKNDIEDTVSDWGQWPLKGVDELPTADEVWTDTTIKNPGWAADKLKSVGVAPPVKAAYTPGEIISGTAANVGYMIGLLEKREAEDKARDLATNAAITTLGKALADVAKSQTGQEIDVDDLVQRIGVKMEDAVLNVKVTVDDNTKQAPPASQ